jgi:hypothetical protein
VTSASLWTDRSAEEELMLSTRCSPSSWRVGRQDCCDCCPSRLAAVFAVTDIKLSLGAAKSRWESVGCTANSSQRGPADSPPVAAAAKPSTVTPLWQSLHLPLKMSRPCENVRNRAPNRYDRGPSLCHFDVTPRRRSSRAGSHAVCGCAMNRATPRSSGHVNTLRQLIQKFVPGTDLMGSLEAF